MSVISKNYRRRKKKKCSCSTRGHIVTLLFVFPLPGLSLHVYDAGDIVHALLHGRSILFGAVVHVQQSGHGQNVCARYPYRGQFGQFLIPRVRRYGGSERFESRADRMHP